MTTECYYALCPHHGIHEGEEGPFCFQPECLATVAQIQHFASARKLETMGYNLEELEKDNPYNQGIL